MHPVTEILTHARSVPAPPRALSQLIDTVGSPDHDLQDVAAVLASDAVLAARVLEVANSAYLGVAGGVASVSRALSVLGEVAVLRVAIAECARALRSKDLSGYCLDADALWRKSLYAALLAEALAERAERPSPAVAYTAGLLLDVGKLGLDHFVGLEIGDLDGDSEDSFDTLERTCLGIDHAQLGAAMADSWGLPATLCTAIAHHHSPLADDPLSQIVHCADTLALNLSGGGIDGMRYASSGRCVEALGLDDAEIDLLVLRTTLRVTELQEQT